MHSMTIEDAADLIDDMVGGWRGMHPWEKDKIKIILADLILTAVVNSNVVR